MTEESTEEWTTVQRKRRPRTTFKPPKYIATWNADITKKDTTLTDEEKLLIQEEMRTNTNEQLIIHCYCCQSHIVSDIIRRSFFSCGRCYCCVGDNPLYDNDEWFVRGCGEFHKYNKDYHYTKENDFYVPH